MNKKVSRRDFMKGAAVGAVGIAAAGLFAGCGTDAGGSSLARRSLPQFRRPERRRTPVCGTTPSILPSPIRSPILPKRWNVTYA